MDSPRSPLRDPVLREALLWLGFALFAYWQALPFDEPQPFNPLGPAFWPKVIIAIMAGWALVLAASRFFTQSSEEQEQPGYLDEIPDDLPPASLRTVAIFVLPLIWTYGMHKLGFLLATLPFLLVFTWVMGVRRPVVLVTFCCGFFAVLVVVFYKLIFTSLPMGVGQFNAINGKLIGWLQ